MCRSKFLTYSQVSYFNRESVEKLALCNSFAGPLGEGVVAGREEGTEKIGHARGHALARSRYTFFHDSWNTKICAFTCLVFELGRFSGIFAFLVFKL